jgi:hypothetical protein
MTAERPQMFSSRILLRRIVGPAATFLACALLPVSDSIAQPAVPDFSGYWVRPNPGRTRIFLPLPGQPGPVMRRQDSGEYDIGDERNPILKPNTAAAIRSHGERSRAGAITFPPWSLCWPSGAPLVLLLGESAQFLQTPTEITILYQRDAQVRRIALNQQHPNNLRPSWYGHSVGHYEGADTLVVDTVGQRPETPVDKFGTPHSAALHLVERYILAPDRSSVRVEFMVDDPDMFTTPWSANVVYQRTNEPIVEDVCAENNRNAAGGLYPIPVATYADF